MKSIFKNLWFIFHMLYLVTVPVIGGFFIARHLFYIAMEKDILTLNEECLFWKSALLGLFIGMYPLAEYVFRTKPWLDEKYKT